MDRYLNDSLMLATALNPVIGYERAAKAAQTASRENMTLREACVKLGYLSAEEYDGIVRPERMI